MTDDLYVQIERALRSLDSELQLHQLIELLSSVQPTWEYVAPLVLTAAKMSTPHLALFIVKFIFMLGKKDIKFFHAIQRNVPNVVLLCFLVSKERESLKLYVSSWLMSNQWKVAAGLALSRIRIWETHARLHFVVNRLEGSGALLSQDCTAEAYESRLQNVIEALNELNSIVK
jgi:hypothetical protein